MERQVNAILAARRIAKAVIAANGGRPPHPVPAKPAVPLGSGAPSGIHQDASVLKQIERIYQTDITVQVPRSGLVEQLFGAILRYSNQDQSHARIILSKELNRCWSRFVLCKEASHIFLGNEGNSTGTARDARQLISILLNESPIANPDAEAEGDAYFAAVELLMPREHIEGCVREFCEYGAEPLVIARSLVVPERVVDFRLNIDEVSGLFEAAYKKEDQQQAA